MRGRASLRPLIVAMLLADVPVALATNLLATTIHLSAAWVWVVFALAAINYVEIKAWLAADSNGNVADHAANDDFVEGSAKGSVSDNDEPIGQAKPEWRSLTYFDLPSYDDPPLEPHTNATLKHPIEPLRIQLPAEPAKKMPHVDPLSTNEELPYSTFIELVRASGRDFGIGRGFSLSLPSPPVNDEYDPAQDDYFGRRLEDSGFIVTRVLSS